MTHTIDHLMCLHYVLYYVLTNVQSFNKNKLQSLSCFKGSLVSLAIS